MQDFEILITSPPDRENLVAEIWLQNQMIAEINQENKTLELEIFVKENGTIKLSYNEFINILKEARKKLVGR